MKVSTSHPSSTLPDGAGAPFRPTGEAIGEAGLYLHVPFCSAICPYCDFAVTRGDGAARARFVEALLVETGQRGGAEPDGAAASGVTFDTIYLGGGTPSLLAPEQLAAILQALGATFRLSPDVWITLEANPEDIERGAVEAWRRLGVRTLSLGVQALDDDALRFLGRRHRRADALRAVEVANAAGFPIVSVDLIYGWPDHDVGLWRRQLREAVALGAEHLSCYELTVHEGTPFARLYARRPALRPVEDQRGELFLATHRELAAAGWNGYEVSNFARTPATRSRHNQKYWRHAPYLGLGPSAHSFDGAARWWNERDVAPWARALAERRSPVAGGEQVGPREVALETLLLGLRTSDGIDLARLRRLGEDLLASRADEIGELEGAGLVELRGDRLAPTLAGMAVADRLALRLAP